MKCVERHRKGFLLIGILLAEGLIEQMFFLGPELLGQFCSAELVVMTPLILSLDVLISLLPSAVVLALVVLFVEKRLKPYGVLLLVVVGVIGHHIYSRMVLTAFAFKDCGATTWTALDSLGSVVLSPLLWFGLVVQWVLALLIYSDYMKKANEK
jgi:hypothetical protein